jgi:transposase InsO family protein
LERALLPAPSGTAERSGGWVLSWRVSITMEVGFCLDALEEALARHGRPEIFNTDQSLAC